MQKFISIINHRDFVLTLALVVGLLMGEYTRPLAEISVITLALVMVFATTGFSFKSWNPAINAIRPIAVSTLLNFIIFGFLIIVLSWLFFTNDPANPCFPYFVGFVLVAASPPGPSVIPFAAILKGDNNFSVSGVFGLHLIAMLLTPLILLLFLGESLINPTAIFNIMVKLIIIPLIISRFLRHPKVLPTVEKHRESIIKWGFFLVIVPIMGMSSSVFLSQPWMVFYMSVILIIAMYIFGFANHIIMAKMGMRRSVIISSTLMMTTKSSAFSAVAAFSFFRNEPMIALPSAVVSVFVTLFIIVYPWFLKLWEKKNPSNVS
jgi:bile acid:Na+ symporter, BASS family